MYSYTKRGNITNRLRIRSYTLALIYSNRGLPISQERNTLPRNNLLKMPLLRPLITGTSNRQFAKPRPRPALPRRERRQHAYNPRIPWDILRTLHPLQSRHLLQCYALFKLHLRFAGSGGEETVPHPFPRGVGAEEANGVPTDVRIATETTNFEEGRNQAEV